MACDQRSQIRASMWEMRSVGGEVASRISLFLSLQENMSWSGVGARTCKSGCGMGMPGDDTQPLPYRRPTLT